METTPRGVRIGEVMSTSLCLLFDFEELNVGRGFFGGGASSSSSVAVSLRSGRAASLDVVFTGDLGLMEEGTSTSDSSSEAFAGRFTAEYVALGVGLTLDADFFGMTRSTSSSSLDYTGS